MNNVETLGRWTTENSEELYGVKNWGSGYFCVSDDGEILVTPGNGNKNAVSLMNIVASIKERGLDMPVVDAPVSIGLFGQR